jgi:N-sulfoglucosamine sulfohydrolase
MAKRNGLYSKIELEKPMKTNRRQFVQQSMLAAGAAAVHTMGLRVEAQEKRPNILFAISDDQSYPHAGAYGCAMVNTPAFDRVAKEGILFTNAYTSAPQCSPNRATILTGKPIWQLEEAGTHASYFPKKFTVFTDLLEESGYHIGYTGKPWSPGNWKDAGWERNPAGPAYTKRKLKAPAQAMSGLDYSANFEDFLADRKKDDPFFFWYGSSEPHRDYEKGIGLKTGKKLDDVVVPPFLPDTDEVRSDILDYAFEIDWFDQHLGNMMAKLEEIGELDNTIIVVTSDNGMPFPGAKATLYDHGIHVPLAIRWGENVKPGRRVDDFIPFIDLAPTFLEAAGLKAHKDMTGRSFLDVVTAEKNGFVDARRNKIYAGRERHSHSRYDNWGYPSRCVRSGDYLYIYNFKSERWPAGSPDYYFDIDAAPTKDIMLEHQRRYPDLFIRSFGKHPEKELFNLQQDPGCLKNLAGHDDYRHIANDLHQDLMQTLKKHRDPRVLGYGDIFESYPRVSPMRPQLGGFAEQGKYNPKYQVNKK